MRPPKEVTEARDVAIREGHARGKTQTEIAAALGVSRRAVGERAKRLGIKLAGAAAARKGRLKHGASAYATGRCKCPICTRGNAIRRRDYYHRVEKWRKTSSKEAKA